MVVIGFVLFAIIVSVSMATYLLEQKGYINF